MRRYYIRATNIVWDTPAYWYADDEQRPYPFTASTVYFMAEENAPLEDLRKEVYRRLEKRSYGNIPLSFDTEILHVTPPRG